MGDVAGSRWEKLALFLSVVVVAALWSVLGPAHAFATQGPIAAYSFDAGEGETLEDLTGNGHEGTIEGATWTPRGKYGSALEFDGENDCVSIPNTEDLQLDEEFTLEAWVRPAPGQSFAPIFFKEIESSSFYSYSLFLGVFETGRLEGFVSKEWPEWAEVESPGPLAGNTWSHVAFTSDGAHLRLYVNGALVDTGPAGEIGESEGPLNLGCWPENNEHYKGKIDEVRVYDRALDAPEVAADMNAELQTPRSGPVAAYAFEEAEGTVAHDYAGGHDGTIEGASWTKGKFGTALAFDSSEEDVVTIPTSPELNLEDFTLEAWVKPAEIHRYDPVIAKTDPDPEAYGYELMAGGDEPSALPEGFITEGEWVHRYTYAEDQLDENAWSHLAVTSDGDKLRFYVNGQLIDTRAGDNVVAGGEAALQIGGNDPFGEFFDGKIDEVRIYDRVLNEAEITTDLHSGIETPQAAPIAAYSFDAAEGETLEDITGEGHDGTIEGATWSARGKYGSALDFDGEEDCVQVPESAEFQFLENEEFTLQAWVRPQGEGIEAILTQEDDSPAGWEEPFSYSMLVGGEEEGPKGWLRKGGKSGHEGVQAPDPLPANAWSHLAFTDDGARMRIYVDGELAGTWPAIPLTATEGPLTIGCLANYGNYFHGRIDEVRVYDRALDAGEVSAGMGPLPRAATTEADGVDPREAVLLGTIDPGNRDTTYKFDYGPTTSYGTVVPEENEEVVTGDDLREVEEGIDELEPETTYHYRLVATNDSGTVVGKDKMLTTPPSPYTVAELEDQRQLLASTKGQGFVNINWSGNTPIYDETSTMNMVQHTGAKMLRIQIADAGELYDEIFRLAAKREITILPVVSGLPGKANLMPEQVGGVREGWRSLVRKIVKRYGHNGSLWNKNIELESLKGFAPDYWEIWNEPNYGLNGDQREHPNPAQFGDLLEESREVIQEEDATAKILFGGLLTVRKKSEKIDQNVAAGRKEKVALTAVGEFIRKVCKAHPEAFNALGLHPYAFKGNLHTIEKVTLNNIQEARKALDNVDVPKCNGKPLWITEIGWPVKGPKTPNDGSHIPISEESQRDRLNAIVTMIKKRSGSGEGGFNIDKVFYYNVQDWIDPRTQEWAYRVGLREELEHVPGRKAKTGEFGKCREAWYAFQQQAHAKSEFVGKCP